MCAALLICKNITKKFGGLTALKEVSFSVTEREILGLIGPNGAGKTTLFNVIAGVYRPDNGTVVFEDQDITNLPPYKRCKLGIARTYQLVRVFDEMNTIDNVVIGSLFGGQRRLSLDEAFREAEELLDFLQISGKKYVLCKELTIVDKKKVEIARALATKPKLLLLDEPSAGLNPAEQNIMIRTLSEIREKRGITIFWIEHVLRMMKICDRILVLNFGALITEGRLEEIARDTRVIEAYLGKTKVV